MGHIELARWADFVVIAPATANFCAHLANGQADHLLSTLALATDAPIAVCPAMNQQMWLNPATRQNLETLSARAIQVWGPASGEQACGDHGPGRMLEATEVFELVCTNFITGLLANMKVMVTAGPTLEAIDPVRFIGNHSSGKMGFAVARAAAEQGADVTLVSGPVALETPPGVTRIDTESALEMHAAVMQRIEEIDIFISAAAVADYRPAAVFDEKIKKQHQELELKLFRNPDILAEVASLEHSPFSVGFAAETQQLEEHARIKLQSKKLDMIAANLVGGEDGGFNADLNALTVISNSEKIELPMQDKLALSRALIQIISSKVGKNARN
jgi:phosphopantothenoylcysteine decarboxylase/phosphopantothenate--cysteine ligase